MITFVLEKVILRNVRCYGDDPMEMDFPLNNLTVLTGHVGAGKSTILKSVSLALYGHDGGAKNKRLLVDDMINEKNGKNLEIHLYINAHNDVDNKDTKYEIHLFHKHTRYRNKLVFVKDGVDISQKTKDATYDLIEKTFIPSGVYHNIYYFTQHNNNFFTSLANSEQKEIFNSILDLSEYRGFYDNARESIKMDETRLEIAQKEFEIYKSNVAVYEKAIQDCESKITCAEKDRDLRLEELSKLNAECMVELKKLEDKIVEIGGVDKIDKLRQDVLVKIEKFDTEKSFELKRIDDKLLELQRQLNAKHEELKVKYTGIKNEKSEQLTTRESEVKVELEKLKADFKSISGVIELTYTKKRADLSKEYNGVTTEIDNKKNEIDKDIISEKSKRDEKLVKIRDDAIAKNEVLKETETQNDVKYNCFVLKDKKDIESKIQMLQDKVKRYESDLINPDAVCESCGQKLVNKEHVQKHIDECKKEIVELTDNLEKLKVQIQECENIKAKVLEDRKAIKKEFEDQKQLINAEYEKIYTDKMSERNVLSTKYIEVSNKYSKDVNETYTEEENEKKAKLADINAKTEVFNKELMDIATAKEKIRDHVLVLCKEEWAAESAKINQESTQLLETKANMEKTYESKMAGYDFELDQYTQQLDDIKKIKVDQDSIIHKMTEYTLEYKRLTEDNSIVDMIKAEMKNSQEKYNQCIEQVKQADKRISDIKYEITALTFWKTAFSDSGIKSMLIDAAIPHMNECVAKELEQVVPGRFVVSFDTLSETKSGKVNDKFNINILNTAQSSTGHKKLSGGEERLIDLCCMSSLRSLSEKLYNKRFMHIFYDEILDSLDDECKQVYCANIKLQSKEGRNITIVTHDLPQDCDPDRLLTF